MFYESRGMGVYKEKRIYSVDTDPKNYPLVSPYGVQEVYYSMEEGYWVSGIQTLDNANNINNNEDKIQLASYLPAGTTVWKAYMLQIIPVKSISPESSVLINDIPFEFSTAMGSTLTDFTDGMVVRVIGLDDSHIVNIPASGLPNGVISTGDAYLGRTWAVEYTWSGAMQGWVKNAKNP